MSTADTTHTATDNTTHTVTADTLAKLFSCTSANIQTLARAKPPRVIRAGRARYHLWESITAYIRYLRKDHLGQRDTDNANLAGADSPRVRRELAQAKLAEIEAARAEGNYSTTAEAVALISDNIANAKTILLALPSRVPPEARTATQAAIHDALSEIAEGKTNLPRA
jgi:phage terminase Nu1 subunit (DNA packaging protein)